VARVRSEAITATWPLATVQTCVVHLVRNSLRYASQADWGKITAGLKTVYQAPTVDAAQTRFADFAEVWRPKYPAMIAMWERSWQEFVPFLDFRACRRMRVAWHRVDHGLGQCCGGEGLPGVAA
jgi:transposase-like protein